MAEYSIDVVASDISNFLRARNSKVPADFPQDLLHTLTLAQLEPSPIVDEYCKLLPALYIECLIELDASLTTQEYAVAENEMAASFSRQCEKQKIKLKAKHDTRIKDWVKQIENIDPVRTKQPEEMLKQIASFKKDQLEELNAIVPHTVARSDVLVYWGRKAASNFIQAVNLCPLEKIMPVLNDLRNLDRSESITQSLQSFIFRGQSIANPAFMLVLDILTDPTEKSPYVKEVVRLAQEKKHGSQATYASASLG